MPVYDAPELEFTRCFRALDKPGKVYLSETHGIIIDQARNAITREALARTDVTHLLFVDADMVFPPYALNRLLSHDLPVVGGLYFNRRPPFHPQLRRANHDDWVDELGLLGVVYDYPDDALVEVDATGCGFLLIQREVLDAMEACWFDKLPGLSEDYSFCARARARGVKIAVDTGLKLGHIGKLVIDEAFAARNRAGKTFTWRPDPKS
jgi:GT2 family glycosyltransferase